MLVALRPSAVLAGAAIVGQIVSSLRIVGRDAHIDVNESIQ